MDSSSISAFAKYKSNKSSNHEKNQNKKKRKQKSQEPPQMDTAVSKRMDALLGQIAEKVKKKKLKRTKEVGKRKTHKKSTAVKEHNKASGKQSKEKKSPTVSVSEDIPELVSAISEKYSNNSQNNITSDGSTCSSGFEFTKPVLTESREEGLKVFTWMIAPFDPNDFLNCIWEKKPLHIARKKPGYYKDIISTPTIDGMLRNETIQFTKNIDITSYIDGQRENHNPEGRAHPHLVWDFYLNGCSIRLLNPQTYIPKLHSMNATLQEFFNSFVGANAYLTPPDSQGFAPHYDDIEAFILQAEGKKHWRIYKPRGENEILPRVSSKNFDQEEVGKPIMEVTLEAGDMLYFPRGYIHQGMTIDCEHSLHVTVSMYQKHSWADFFEKLIPAALQSAIEEHIDLRRGLPFDIYDNFGLVYSDGNTPRRTEIKQLVMTLFEKIRDHLPIDEAVDQMHKNYQQDALPPVLSFSEKAVTVHGDSDIMVSNGKVIKRVEMGLGTKIRLLRKNILRMVSEERIRLYYHAENSLEYHGNESTFLEIEENLAPAIETLILSYPNYVEVENLDLEVDTDKLQIADALWSRGLIMSEYPLDTIAE